MVTKSKRKKLERKKQKTKRVQVGWKHFREEAKDYVLVPLSKGSGSRYATLPISISRMEVMKFCQSMFFPNGKSHYGDASELEFSIGNFHNEQVGVTLEVNDRREVY